MYAYTQQKPLLLQKHKLVYEKLLSIQDPLHYDLTRLKELIDTNNTYNIYLTDEHFIIKNTTFKNDLGFNLSFAKEIFYKHKAQHTIGVSIPIYEKSTQQFFSFTDSFFPLSNDKEGILQVSYIYKKESKDLQTLKNEINTYPIIISAKAFLVSNEGVVTSILLHNHKKEKRTLDELIEDLHAAKKIQKELKNINLNQLYIKDIAPTTKHLYIVSQSPIFSNTKIYFSLIIDQQSLYTHLEYLKYLYFFLIILGIVAILTLWHFLLKEKSIHFQDTFLSSTMHEIKTPLSIISLNTELLELKQGKNKHTQAIDNALKLLQNTYEDLHFTMNKTYSYPKEIITLCSFLQQRIEYFKPIITAANKELFFHCSSQCHVFISPQELERLIDNNLSNAIKYAKPHSTIKVTCKKNTISFTTFSTMIQNKKKIFQRYYRENTLNKGHGLGLWIVKEIAQQNNIQIYINSTKEETVFTYEFNCIKKGQNEHSIT